MKMAACFHCLSSSTCVNGGLGSAYGKGDVSYRCGVGTSEKIFLTVICLQTALDFDMLLARVSHPRSRWVVVLPHNITSGCRLVVGLCV